MRMKEMADDVIAHKNAGHYFGLAVSALLLAVVTVYFLVKGSWVYAVDAYIAATCARLIAGGVMNRMGDVDAVNAWNDKYHRGVVIALNSVVGFVLLGRLAYAWFAYHTHGEALAALGLAFAGYFIAAKFTRPNTFGARLRSAALTVVLIGEMAYLAWPRHWGLLILGAVIVFNFVWLRLRTLQRRFGWETR